MHIYSTPFSPIKTTENKNKPYSTPITYKQPLTHQDTFTRSTNDKPNKKLLIGSLLTVLAGAVGVGILIKNKKGINNHAEIKKLKEIAKLQKKNFPNDVQYKERLLQALGLSAKDDYKLTSIIGTEEFEHHVKKLSLNPKEYNPGTKIYDSAGRTIGLNKENVSTCDFGANFHLHTVHSDGNLTIKELLDNTAIYADKRFEKHKKPFIFAITDHDSVEGCKEALNIIKENPYKYRNIKLVLGIENTTTHTNPEHFKEPVQVHVLSYGINPYSKDIQECLTTRVNQNKHNISTAIENANSNFGNLRQKYGFNYSFQEISEMVPSLNGSVKGANYLTKDYLQFKLIYSDAIGHNEALTKLFKENSVNIEDYKFYDAIKRIPKNPDYSKGQKYWDYYYEALKEDIVVYAQSKKPELSADTIKSKFKPINDDTKDALQQIEWNCFNKNHNMYIPNPTFPDFNDTIKKLSNFEDGVIGIAHPGVFFPYNSIKDRNKIPDAYNNLYSNFVKNGGDKAKYVEDYYQIYYQNNLDEPYKLLPSISEKYGLLKTGGLDTHSKDICSC